MAQLIECYHYPHHLPTTPIADYGRGRRCEECGRPVSRYTPPQDVTGLTLCNLHPVVPEGYCLSGSGRSVKER